MSETSIRNEPLSPPVRLWPLLLVIAVAVTAACFRQQGWIAVSDKPSRDLLWIFAIAELAVYLVVRLACRLPLVSQVVVLTALAIGQVSIYAATRVDGFTGDGRLILAWRWAPTVQEVFNRDRERQPVKKSAGLRADLKTTTRWDSPAFRGAQGDGRVDAPALGRDWNRVPPKKLWSKSIGAGWSSFAVVGDYAVTQEQREKSECVVCYRVSTGEEIWEQRDRTEFFEVTGGSGPRATPTIEKGQVYSLGATGMLNCLDGAKGKKIWSVDIAKDCQTSIPLFGFASSPLVVDGLVFVIAGGKGTSLAAYEADTGRKKWLAGDSAASYGSPQLWEIEGARQILAFNSDGLAAHDQQTGDVVWKIDWACDSADVVNVCQPLVLPGTVDGELARVFISSGYGRGCALYSLRRPAEDYAVEQIWTTKSLKSKFSSVVVRDGYVYGLDEGILTCVNLSDGNRSWKRGRYGYGQLLLVADLLMIQSESGEVALVEASPLEHKELSRFTALADRTWNHPVLSGNLLLMRNDRNAACYELPGE